MKIIKSVLFFSLAFLVVGCNNENKDVPLVKTVYHIHKFKLGDREMTDGEYTSTFYYDSDNNFTHSVGSNGIQTIRKQTGQNIIFEDIDSTGKVLKTTVVFINNEGLEDSLEQNQGPDANFSAKYFYDANGFLMEERQYVRGRPKFVIKHKPVNGNSILDSLIYSFEADTQIIVNQSSGRPEPYVMANENMTIFKEYFLDKSRIPANANFGNKIKDRSSINLEKRDIVVNSNGDTVNIVNYRFTFDEKGRVSSAVHELVSGTEYDSVAYTYY